MSDRRLSQLERIAASSEDLEDKLAYYHYKRRFGFDDLDKERLIDDFWQFPLNLDDEIYILTNEGLWVFTTEPPINFSLDQLTGYSGMGVDYVSEVGNFGNGVIQFSMYQPPESDPVIYTALETTFLAYGGEGKEKHRVERNDDFNYQDQISKESKFYPPCVIISGTAYKGLSGGAVGSYWQQVLFYFYPLQNKVYYQLPHRSDYFQGQSPQLMELIHKAFEKTIFEPIPLELP